jgi:hypothetical protein
MCNLSELIASSRWVLWVYFDLISSLDKKKWGVKRLDLDSKALSSFIWDLSLVEIETINVVHTWNNRRGCYQ